MANSRYVRIAPAIFEETRNVHKESPNQLYEMPDFLETTKEMREKLFQLQSLQGCESSEPTNDKVILRQWKDGNRRQYGVKNDFRIHELVALLSARNFEKVLQIGENAGTLFKTGKVSTYTFKSINKSQTEAEIHDKLSEILSGNVTVRKLNTAGKKNHTEDGSLCKQLNEMVKQLKQELEQWKSKCAEFQRRLHASNNRNSEISHNMREMERTLDSLKERGVKDNERLQKEIDQRDEMIRQLNSSLLSDVLQNDELQDSGLQELRDSGFCDNLEEDESSENTNLIVQNETADEDSAGGLLANKMNRPNISKNDKPAVKETFEVTTSSGFKLMMTDCCHGSTSQQSLSDIKPKKKEAKSEKKPEGTEEAILQKTKEKNKKERNGTKKAPLVSKMNSTQTKTPHQKRTLDDVNSYENFASDDEQDEDFKTPPKKHKRASRPKTSTPLTTEKSQSASQNESDDKVVLDAMSPQHVTNVESEFVAVGYTGAKPRPPTFYLGKIVAGRDDSILTVTFLEKIKGGKGYKWPKKPLMEEVYPHQIFRRNLQFKENDDGSHEFDEDKLMTEFNVCLFKLSELERRSKIEAIWQDTEAQYQNVGLVCWRDFKTLQLEMPEVHHSLMMLEMPKGWKMGYINDEIISQYMKLLEKKAVKQGKKIISGNTQFYQTISRGISSWRKKVDLNKFDKLVFANQFSPNHWCLVAVDLKNSTLSILDPLGEDEHSNSVFENLRRFLKQRSVIREWREKSIRHPLQNDAVSCGVYVLKMAESIMLQSFTMEFTQDDIREYRYIVAERLLESANFLRLS